MQTVTADAAAAAAAAAVAGMPVGALMAPPQGGMLSAGVVLGAAADWMAASPHPHAHQAASPHHPHLSAAGHLATPCLPAAPHVGAPHLAAVTPLMTGLVPPLVPPHGVVVSAISPGAMHVPYGMIAGVVPPGVLGVPGMALPAVPSWTSHAGHYGNYVAVGRLPIAPAQAVPVNGPLGAQLFANAPLYATAVPVQQLHAQPQLQQALLPISMPAASMLPLSMPAAPMPTVPPMAPSIAPPMVPPMAPQMAPAIAAAPLLAPQNCQQMPPMGWERAGILPLGAHNNNHLWHHPQTHHAGHRTDAHWRAVVAAAAQSAAASTPRVG